jgi:hypothetical protein
MEMPLVMVNIPISIGELWDKISILEIKSIKIRDNKKLKNIIKEQTLLKSVAPKIDIVLYSSLFKINEQLWEVEDKIRVKERNSEFDQEFIELARSVYKLNDERASIKYEINQQYGSELIEEKSYE